MIKLEEKEKFRIGFTHENYGKKKHHIIICHIICDVMDQLVKLSYWFHILK